LCGALCANPVTRVYLSQVSVLLRRLSIAYLLYFITRLIFFVYNRSLFPGVGITDFIGDAWAGLRFDSFSIAASNSLFILLSLMPPRWFNHSWYQRMLKWLFVIVNAVFVSANVVDTGYFKFIHRRSTSDLFAQLSGQTDVLSLLPQIVGDFWQLVLGFVILVWLGAKLYSRTRLTAFSAADAITWRDRWACVLIFLFVAGVATLGLRGGFQRVPIDLVNAGAMTSANEVPIVLNSPFTIIKSFSHRTIEELTYFSDRDLDAIYSPHHQFPDAQFRKENIVVLILESFSKEYTKLGEHRDLTPFLDSLMDHSLVYSNGYSNGTKSIEGIPAILSSLPSLLEDPYINSMYANNRQTSFASLLKSKGYTSAFFHGGINGTMNFDDWAKQAGYDRYYGRNEYGNDRDFDGYWGIWDEPFLQFAAQNMSVMHQPFHTAIFTLSSHHPYFIPSQYSNQIKSGPLENSASIRYADISLRKFFETASKTNWYRNTLFILVADHCGISDSPFYSNPVGFLSIPILFFRPDNSLTGVNSHGFSQIDILPAAMRLTGYEKPFFAFGNGFRDTTTGFCPWYMSGIHHVFNDSLTFWYRNSEPIATYNYRRDSLLNHNIIGSHPAIEATAAAKYRAFLQSYHHALIHNAGQSGD
jgi:phosphoglycerol transferase MdoB-like AlkP superfamily enzyme